MQKEVEELTEEIQEKNKYISRFRRNSQVFEDDLLNYEKEHCDEINTYKKDISRLNTEIIQVLDRNSYIQNDLQRTRESLEGLKVLNCNMKVSIGVPEKENDVLSKETKRLCR
ncbi:unnamed protein product [Ceutorhynchus assimilis]|uniref:Uncharacterized protein n=1 Tax=Ceutorhynchus assimilis TaxID=467358 RepID=A0A9N9MVN9_9CUCU|nr:unnamed protein product [Ceutorhynchus assimilis]